MNMNYWIPATCPSCGANMSVSKGRKDAHCPYCNSDCIASDAIAKFNATYMNNYINANNAYFGDTKKDFDIVAGTLKKYSGEAVDVVIPNTVEYIDFGAFEGQGIHTVTIPDSVTRIGYRAFSSCEKLTQVGLYKISSIGDYAFFGCHSLTEVFLYSALSEIGRMAFGGTNVKTIALGHKTKVKYCAFENTPLEKISIDESLSCFLDEKRWEYADSLWAFAGADHLKKIIFTDFCLTPKILEEEYEFDDKKEYDLMRKIFRGNKPFAEAINRRVDRCFDKRICPICRHRVEERSTATNWLFPAHTSVSPAHCPKCGLPMEDRYLYVADTRNPETYTYDDCE